MKLAARENEKNSCDQIGRDLSGSNAKPTIDSKDLHLNSRENLTENLSELMRGIETLSVTGPAEAEIRAITYDSRKATPHSLFFAFQGAKVDGNRFVADALSRGAVAIATESPRPSDVPASVAWIQLAPGSERRALATASANFFHHPASALQLVGITGTNGKTTTSFLVDSILRAAGQTTGLIGTTGYRMPDGERQARNTTPESLDLQEMFSIVRKASGTSVVLEASSHALAMDRLWGCHFAAAVFTNLTHDHMNFHRTFDAYFAAKRRLFEGTGAGPADFSIVNVDDSWGARLREELVQAGQRTLTYGLNPIAEITAPKFELEFSGLNFIADSPAGNIEVQSPLVGRVNVYNILAAIGAAIALRIPIAAIEKGIRSLENVPGRFELIDEGQPFHVAVDYAHADDAIRNLLRSARELNPLGRVLLLFGAGGERDRTTRPLMGEAAGRNTQLVVLTSDNPRSEDPSQIIGDVVVGLQKANANYRIEPDREKALELILKEAQPGDLVLLAGKGHETYQILHDRTFEFDDRKMARKALRALGYGRLKA
ncbi:MAG: UDP-N-acetylmuramoyl-L-alanyl-D-glutamate--2,6-diaminopimelate ligase [Candidatus Acidiferrales bacterium]|jgi:UDP-N-acetylmuramoyl-L-alanyl-D-glutamate--2,6-diaminopimelate ligase